MQTRLLKIAAVVLIMAGLFYVSTSQMTKAQKEPARASAENAAVGNKLVIVDVQRVLASSKAGQNIQKQMTAKQEKIDSDASKKDDALKAKKAEIEKKQGEMKKEDLLAAAEKFQSDISQARQELNKESQELKLAASQAVNQLRLEIIKVVSEMASENNYALVLTKQNVILAQKEMDITDEVLAKLDENITTIKLATTNNN